MPVRTRPPSAPVRTPELAVIAQPGAGLSIALKAGQRTLVTTPPEGMWSVACDWRDSWAAGCVHGGPSSQAQQMEHTNYTQVRGAKAARRGGYNEDWTVSGSRPIS